MPLQARESIQNVSSSIKPHSTLTRSNSAINALNNIPSAIQYASNSQSSSSSSSGLSRSNETPHNFTSHFLDGSGSTTSSYNPSQALRPSSASFADPSQSNSAATSSSVSGATTPHNTSHLNLNAISPGAYSATMPNGTNRAQQNFIEFVIIKTKRFLNQYNLPPRPRLLLSVKQKKKN